MTKRAVKLGAEVRKAIKACSQARKFPVNTCPTSRHAYLIGEAMARGVAQSDSEHMATSILWTVALLWKARTKLAALEKAPRKAVTPRARQRG